MIEKSNREDYKQTEVGIIPEDWNVVNFGDVIDYTKGFAFKSKDYTDNGRRVLRVSDTTFNTIKDENEIFIKETDANNYKTWQLKEDDLVFSTVGSKPPMFDSLVGRVILINKKYDGCLLNQNAVLIRSKNKTKYKQQLLLHHFRTKRYIQFIEKIFRGNANQASITLNDLFKFLIPLPMDEDEQKIIAQVLSDADILIEKLENLIEKKKNIKKGVMQELLTGKLRVTGKKSGYKQTEVGKIPSDWNVTELTEVTRSHKQGFYTSERYVKQGVKIVRITDLMNPHIDYASMPILNISRTDLDLYKIQIGDFLFARSGAIGRYGIVYDDIEAVFGSYIIRFTFDSAKLKNEYFGFLYETEIVRKQLLFITQGSSNININASNIKSIKIPLPDIDEQTLIVTILSDIDKEIEEIEMKRDKYIMLKKGMMQKLLTGQIRLK